MADDRSTRQAQLQKALSTAYLNHQISELETKVQGLGVKVQHDKAVGRIDDSSADEEDGERDKDGEWRVAVVDVSALLWALKSVKRIVKKGWEVIVPLDALRTLDHIKSGQSPSAQAARAAARYIEHASRHHRLLSSDPSITIQLGTNYKKGRGMRIQHDDESLAPEEVSEFVLHPADGVEIPKWVRSVLGCAAFFLQILNTEVAVRDGLGMNDIEEGRAALFVANPPLTVEVVEMDISSGKSREGFVERGEGFVISQEAERFELGVEVLRDDDDEVGQPEFGGGRGKGGHIRGSRGRGRGRGGRGGVGGAARGGKVEEPEREFKILLRRPPTEDESLIPPPALSSSQPTSSPKIKTSPMPEPKGSPLSQPRVIPEHHTYPRPPPFVDEFVERGWGGGGRGRGGHGRGFGGFEADRGGFDHHHHRGGRHGGHGDHDRGGRGGFGDHEYGIGGRGGFGDHDVGGRGGGGRSRGGPGGGGFTLLRRPGPPNVPPPPGSSPPMGFRPPPPPARPFGFHPPPPRPPGPPLHHHHHHPPPPPLPPGHPHDRHHAPWPAPPDEPPRVILLKRPK